MRLWAVVSIIMSEISVFTAGHWVKVHLWAVVSIIMSEICVYCW